MRKSFFEELNSGIDSGVAYKNLNLKKSIISFLSRNKNVTIPDLSKELNLSVPKVTNIINDLIEDGLVRDNGKITSNGGRRPSIYGLEPESGFFLGIDVKKNYLNLGIMDFQNNIIKITENHPYELSNDKASLDELCTIISRFIGKLPIPREKILGIGINLSGRVNYATGYSYSFFNFQEDPLSKIIENYIGIPVYLENDSRAMAYGEFTHGIVKDEKNVLFLNLDYGLGMGIMIDQEIYYGKSGFAGEFGHIPLFDNDIICNCGKKGCLETEASGWALVEMFKKEIQNGTTTALDNEAGTPIILENIIKAALNDDVLAIELVAKVGSHLGKAISILINIFNPELVILGGALAETGDYLRLPILSAINKYSLSRVNSDTAIKISKLGNKVGVIGSCLLVRNRLLSIS
ncbi:ROK family protein (putative glucokinase) [Sinomicrobium oceani]|uniref:ROK family protein (Putative glucokinase) n=1 Tax=Sinomicrobium oceani TaxID=1150368 RepID=A0A1K1Q393_9FLAO|nr:ROK family transcriptional regulator [Sinomicrobium oceani]SFW54228.1 ROK family protein (putative glucokinase) [Sinomicrobium oceani]